MSYHANEKLRKIKECQIENAATWPIDVPLCLWQGGIDATWAAYVGENLLTAPVSAVEEICVIDAQLSAPNCSFVYLWCFTIHGRQYYKVGYTTSMLRRYRAFLNKVPPTVMTHLGVYHVSLLPSDKADEAETAFTIAARDFYIGNEWFSFTSVGDTQLAEIPPRKVEPFFAVC